jgi:hypothetical protein
VAIYFTEADKTQLFRKLAKYMAKRRLHDYRLDRVDLRAVSGTGSQTLPAGGVLSVEGAAIIPQGASSLAPDGSAAKGLAAVSGI